MAKETTTRRTKPGTCPNHGQVEAVKEMPVFTPPGLFYSVRRVGSAVQPYRCPTCGEPAG